jgi:SAM-dependent methyltransferase
MGQDHNRLLSSECKICSSTRLQPHWQVNGFTIVKCAKCNFIFVQEELTDEELFGFYADLDPDYDNDANNANLSFYYSLLKQLIEKKFPTGRICDVGCARGGFLDIMTGWDRYGTEISSITAPVAQRKFGANVVACDFPAAPWPDGYFDVITMQDSFDHMRDPMAALATSRRLLKKGGLLIIKIHDIGSLVAKISGSRYYALVPPAHLSYFDKKTIALALTKGRFHVEGIHYLPQALYISTIFHRLSFNRKDGLFRSLAEKLDGTLIGGLRFKKNLYDIMTVFAAKD